jgi:ubiquitin C-terminal hydrolase
MWLEQQQFDHAPIYVEEPSVGLQNLGNMCFLNAVIQCLYHTPMLQRVLSRICPNPADESLDEWIGALLQIFSALDQARSCASPVEATRIAALMLRASTNGEFMRGAQADAHEAFFVANFKVAEWMLTIGRFVVISG